MESAWFSQDNSWSPEAGRSSLQTRPAVDAGDEGSGPKRRARPAGGHLAELEVLKMACFYGHGGTPSSLDGLFQVKSD